MLKPEPYRRNGAVQHLASQYPRNQIRTGGVGHLPEQAYSQFFEPFPKLRG